MQKTIGFSLSLLLALTACNTNLQPEQESKEETKQIKYTGNGRPPNSQIDSPLVEEKNEEVFQSKDIVQLTEQVKGVERAHVIVSGIYTLVGIEPANRVEPGEENDQLRQEVYAVIKGNAHGRNAAITTDPKKVDEIKRMGKKIQHGKDHELHRGIYNEMGLLIGKIKPLSGQHKSTERQEMHDETDQTQDDLYE